MAILQDSMVGDLRGKFYNLLTNFATFPTSQNFFIVNIKNLPSSLNEANVNDLGIRPGTGESTGLDYAKDTVFQKYFDEYMFLATGVDLTTEVTNVNNRGKLINGILPVGPFMESREYPDNDLDIQFSDTNVSIIDSIFRSWIQLYSVYGNFGDVRLSTDISIYFLAKEKCGLENRPPHPKSVNGWSEPAATIPYRKDASPVITKIYTYKDCIPYVIKSANVAQYSGDSEIGSVAVGFRFSKYDVRIPITQPTEDNWWDGSEDDEGWRYEASEQRLYGEEVHDAREPDPAPILGHQFSESPTILADRQAKLDKGIPTDVENLATLNKLSKLPPRLDTNSGPPEG